MSRKAGKMNWHMVVEPCHPYIVQDQAEDDRYLREALDEIKASIKAMPGVGGVWLQNKPEFVCEHCGGDWTEDSPNYNGGCCSEDEKANPKVSA